MKEKLLAAVTNNDLNTLNKLLVDPKHYTVMDEATDAEGKTLAFVAAEYGHTEVLKLLIKAGADVKITANNGWEPYYAAAKNNHVDTFLLLNNLRGNPNQPMKNGPPIYIAALNGHDHAIILLIDVAKADVNNANNINGWTATMIAAKKGNDTSLEILIKNGADVNQAAKDGWTALMVAACYGQTHALELLLKAGADINKTENSGFSALFIAASFGQSAAIDLLIKTGADVNKTSKYGTTPIFIAAQNGHSESINLLIKAGADASITNTYGTTAIFVAAQNGHTDTVSLLINAGVDINMTNHDGISPAFIAAQNGHARTLKLLIKASADIYKANNDGVMPAYIAAQNGHTDVINLFIKTGADVDAMIYNGRTPLQIAQENKRENVVYILEIAHKIKTYALQLPQGKSLFDCIIAIKKLGELEVEDFEIMRGNEDLIESDGKINNDIFYQIYGEFLFKYLRAELKDILHTLLLKINSERLSRKQRPKENLLENPNMYAVYNLNNVANLMDLINSTIQDQRESQAKFTSLIIGLDKLRARFT